MRIAMFGAAVVFAVLAFPAAPASGPQIADGDNCFVMKQRVLSVTPARVAVVNDPGSTSGIKMNRSGITARSDEAKQHIMAGDRACEASDLEAARIIYQRAIDAMTSPN